MKHSLRKQLLSRILMVLLVIVILSSFTQLYLINKQIANNVGSQADMVSQNVMDGIYQTETASKSIEHQIDLRMVGYAETISLMLHAETANQITTQGLKEASDQLGLQGITIFVRKNNDIVGVKSTDPKEIGFSFKQFGEAAYSSMDTLMKGLLIKNPTFSYTSKNILVLPISQSGSHKNQPIFNKYAYYHPPGTDYIIDPYIQANQIYQFTQAVGPNQQIKNMVNSNPYLREIAVLNPSSFKDPKLEKSLYNPIQQIQYGSFELKNQKDIELVKQMADHPAKTILVEKIHGKKFYQMFIPTKDGKVIYLAFDYQKMTKPLYRHSIILILTGLISLLLLFLLTARFFNKIYENIKKIKTQITQLESGNLTAESDVRDGSELEDLSNSANKMAEHLNSLVKETQEQALKTQRLSVLLESDASESLDKMYQISTEATMKSREQFYEITEFLNKTEETLQINQNEESVKQVLEAIKHMREIANERTAATTDMTLTLSDLLKSLHGQSSELSDISNILLEHMGKFKL